MKYSELKRRVQDLERDVEHLRQRAYEAGEQLAVVLTTAERPTARGLWGTSSDLFWVKEQPHEKLLLYPAPVMLDGVVARNSTSEYGDEANWLPWELLSRSDLEARSVKPPNGQQHVPSPCPEVKFPLGTVERLGIVRDTLQLSGTWLKPRGGA